MTTQTKMNHIFYPFGRQMHMYVKFLSDKCAWQKGVWVATNIKSKSAREKYSSDSKKKKGLKDNDYARVFSHKMYQMHVGTNLVLFDLLLCYLSMFY